MRKKAPSIPKVGLPKASSVNEVVSMDLKDFRELGGKPVRGYILYFLDEFTKIIKGLHIKDKEKETIVDGIYRKWIVGDGLGP